MPSPISPPVTKHQSYRRKKPTIFSLITMLQEVWAQRELLTHLTVRNLRVQHKQSVLGYAWLILNPLVYLLTLTFVFSTIFKAPSGGSPFILFLSIGLFPWIFFASAIAQATDSVVGAQGLITSVYFPRQFVVISAVLIRLLDFAVGIAIVGGAMIYYQQPLTWHVVWVPVLFGLQFLFVLGMAMPLAALNLFFHDFRFLVAVLLNLWFFLTPIMYSVDIVPAKYRLWYDLNPIARLITAYRAALLDGASPPTGSLIFASMVTLVVLVVGCYLFQRMESAFADNI